MRLGIWRLIRGWLDPVVADKVRFTSGRKGLEEFIEPKNLIKELGGEDDWTHSYEEPVPGENEKLTDTAARDRLLVERKSLTKEFVATSNAWLKAPDDAHQMNSRSVVVRQIRANYVQLDPYLRSRTLFDRQGTLAIADADLSTNKPKEENGPGESKLITSIQHSTWRLTGSKSTRALN